MILERGDKNKVRLIIPYVTALREFPSHSTGRRTKVEPDGLLELKRRSGESEETKAVTVPSIEYQVGKCCTERQFQSSVDSPLEYLQSTDWCMYMRKLLKVGERTIWEDWRELVQCSHKARNSTCSRSQTRKPYNTQGNE